MQNRVLTELAEMDHASVDRKYYQMVCQVSFSNIFSFFFFFLNFLKPFIFFFPS